MTNQIGKAYQSFVAATIAIGIVSGLIFGFNAVYAMSGGAMSPLRIKVLLLCGGLALSSIIVTALTAPRYDSDN